jgi:hypothetical protein
LPCATPSEAGGLVTGGGGGARVVVVGGGGGARVVVGGDVAGAAGAPAPFVPSGGTRAVFDVPLVVVEPVVRPRPSAMPTAATAATRAEISLVRLVTGCPFSEWNALPTPAPVAGLVLPASGVRHRPAKSSFVCRQRGAASRLPMLHREVR